MYLRAVMVRLYLSAVVVVGLYLSAVVVGLSPGLEISASMSLASMYSSSLLFPSVSAMPSFPP